MKHPLALTLLALTSAAHADATASLKALKTPDPAALVENEAGARGFVKVDPKTSRLIFEDGTTARFYGVNFIDYLNEPNRKVPIEEMREVLSDLKALGVNVIRFQSYDNRIQKGTYGKGLNPVALENRDRFIAEGKKMGIYFHMTLNVAGHGKGGATELLQAANGSRELLILIDELINNQKKYLVELLNHVNPYTGLAYKDEPAIIALQLGNEQHAYSRPQWQLWSKHTGPYAEEIQSKWNRFLLEKYASREKLQNAWGGLLEAHEDPAKGSVAVGDARYPTWKDRFIPDPRQADMIAFADAMQAQFHVEMRKAIREDAGDTRHLISDNGWIRGDAGIRKTAFEHLDLLDLQHYWPHGDRRRLSAEEDYEVSPIKGCGINIIASMLTGRELNGQAKPEFITEYNSHKDNARLFQLVPVHALYAMLTGVDGLALWLYSTGDASSFFNKDHWFSFNRGDSDLTPELIPFLVGSYLWRTSIPALVNQAAVDRVAKWDDSNPAGLSVDYDASLQQAVSLGKFHFPEEGILIDFNNDFLSIEREDVILHTGKGKFDAKGLSFSPLDPDEPYLLAVFPFDGKPLSSSRNWRVFSTHDGDMKLSRPEFTKWTAFSRSYAKASSVKPGGSIKDSLFRIRRPLNAIYMDVTAQ